MVINHLRPAYSYSHYEWNVNKNLTAELESIGNWEFVERPATNYKRLGITGLYEMIWL